MRFKRKNLRTKGAANSLLGGGKRKGGKSLELRDVGKSFASWKVGKWGLESHQNQKFCLKCRATMARSKLYCVHQCEIVRPNQGRICSFALHNFSVVKTYLKLREAQLLRQLKIILSISK